jgi:outer membrane immunogenic protein
MNAGYESTKADDGVAATPNSMDGLRVGAAIGYDMAVGKTVIVGIEAGGGYAVSGAASARSGTTSFRLTSGRDLDASLRIGVRATPATLVYAKGGYANSEFRLRTTTAGNAATTLSEKESGWRIGAGVEHAFGSHVYAKAEYRYTNYGDDVTRHQGLLGLGYRF